MSTEKGFLSRNNGMGRTKDTNNFRNRLFSESVRALSAQFSKSKLKSVDESVDSVQLKHSTC